MAYEPRQLFNFMQGSDISGESAYDIWKRLGNTGSEADFLEFIRTGPQGPKGDPGESAVSYHLLASDTVIKRGLNGVAVPANVTFGSYYLIGTDVVRHTYSGRFVVQESVNGLSWEAKYTSTKDESTITYTPTENAAFIRCTLYSAGGSAVELDVQSVAVLTEVKPDDLEVLSATLTNDAHVVATDGNGENGDYSECITTIQVFSGIRDVTAECTFETNTCDGLTGEWDLASRTYTVTGLSSDTGYVDIIATYNEVTVTKRFSISKTKFGKSAYEIWLEIPGNEGKTEEDFINSTGNGYTDQKVAAALIEFKNYADDELAKEVTARNDAIALESAARTAAINNAISTEVTNRNEAIETAKGEANEYTDEQIESAKAAANSYTDQKVSAEVTARDNAITAAKTEVNGYTDEQINAAKTAVNGYTDQKVAAEATARDTAIETAKGEANEYTDAQIAAAKKESNAYVDKSIGDLIGAAPETKNTIEELAAAIEEHQEVTDLLNAAIGNKANATDLTDHIDDGDVHITSGERLKWDASEANAKSYTDTAIGTAKTEVNGYTDDQIAAAKTAVNKYTDDELAKEVTARDNAIATAKGEATEYTDEQITAAKTAVNSYTDNAISAAKSEVNGYTDDQIAAAKEVSDKYTDDKIAAEVTARDNAITAAKEEVNGYTDDQITAAKTVVNSYTDNQITAAKEEVKGYTDDQITAAKAVSDKYTDDKIAAEVTARNEAIEAAKEEINDQNSEASSNAVTQMTEYTDAQITAAKTEVNGYTDEQIVAAKTVSDKYTDDKVAAEVTARNEAIGTAKEEANGYTDDQITAAKTAVNTYTDEQIAATKTEVNGYADTQDAATLANSKSYTDQQIAAIVTNVPEEITVELGTNGAVGGYKTGDVIEAGTELQVILNKLFQKAIPPTYTAPKATVAAKDTASGSYEYGTNITALIQASFTQNDGGALQSISILKDGVEVKTGTTSPLSSDSEDIQLLTTVAYKATASYAEGAVKKNNIGEDWPDGHIEAGSVSSSELKFTPYRQGYFYGVLDTDSSVPLTSDIIRSCNMKNAAYAAGNMPLISASSVANRKRIFVACPATNRGVTKVIMPSAMQSDCTNDFVKQSTTVTVEGANGSTGIAYNVWVYEPAAISDDQTFTVTLG